MLSFIMCSLVMLSLILLFLSFFLKTPSQHMKREKLSAFECGFDPNHKMRNSFSLRFFIITVVFLIFDVEITIMFPIPLSSKSTPLETFNNTNICLFLLLSGGLFFEWSQGALELWWVFI